MGWRVVASDDGRRAVKIVVESEEQAPIRALFFALPEDQYPRLVESSLRGVGLGYNEVGVTFHGDLDPGDDSVPAGQVEIYDALGEVLLPEHEYYRLLHEVVSKSLEIRERAGALSESQKAALESRVVELRNRLAS